ncbi:MAG: hypothetical protein AAF330_03800 [Pseudomonadota bacterium]
MSSHTEAFDTCILLLEALIYGRPPAQNKREVCKRLIAAAGEIKVSLLLIEQHDRGYCEEVLQRFEDQVNRLIDRLIITSVGDESVCSYAMELRDLLKSTLIAIKSMPGATTPAAAPALDMESVAGFCREVMAVLQTSQAAPSILQNLRLQLSTILRMSELSPRFSEKILKRELKVLLADIVIAWSELERSDAAERTHQIAEWCGTIITHGDRRGAEPVAKNPVSSFLALRA